MAESNNFCGQHCTGIVPTHSPPFFFFFCNFILAFWGARSGPALIANCAVGGPCPKLFVLCIFSAVAFNSIYSVLFFRASVYELCLNNFWSGILCLLFVPNINIYSSGLLFHGAIIRPTEIVIFMQIWCLSRIFEYLIAGQGISPSHSMRTKVQPEIGWFD